MNEEVSANGGRDIVKLLRSPWGIAAIILAIFVFGELYLSWRDRVIEDALETSQAFRAPVFELTFSKNLPYDPLSFIGKGASAGFWQWSQNGLVLTPQGQQFFGEEAGMFVAHAAAGKRRIQRIRVNEGAKDGDRHIEFIYEWTEVSPLAALLSQPPRTNEEYPGQALMSREGTSWKLKSLRTDDFDQPLAHLQDVASGVLK
jgi:hypothetical protein